MASEVIETVLRFKADASQLRAIAADLERLNSTVKKVQSEGLDKLAAKMSPFTAGGLLGGAVLAWFALATTATTAYVGAIVGLTKSAAQSADELRKLGLVTKDQADAAEKAGASVGALGTTWDLFAFTLAEDVSPSLLRVTRLLVAAGLAASDVAAKISAGRLLLESGAVAVGAAVAGGMGATTVRGLLNVGGTGALDAAAGDYLARADALISALDNETEGQKKAGAAADKHADAIRRLTIAQQQAIGIHATFTAAVIGAGNAGNRGLLSGDAAQTAANLGLLGRNDANAAGQASAGNGVNSPDSANAAGKGFADRSRQYAAQTLGAWQSAASGIVGALSGAFGKTAAAQKAWALVSIAVNTAVAIMQAAASAPFPYNLGPIAAMTALGAVQFAAAASGSMAKGGVSFGGGQSLTAATPAGYTPSSQSQGGPGGGGGTARSHEITVRTVGGLAPVRDLIEALNAHLGGRGMRLKLGDLMGNGYLYYYPEGDAGLQTLDLGEGFEEPAVQSEPVNGETARGLGGQVFPSSLGRYDRVTLRRNGIVDTDVEAALCTFESYAESRRYFAASADHAKSWAGYCVRLLTRGATSIPTNGNAFASLSASGTIAANDYIIIESGYPEFKREKAKVAAYSANTITLSAGLKRTYRETPILVRWVKFWPFLVAENKGPMVVSESGISSTFSVEATTVAAANPVAMLLAQILESGTGATKGGGKATLDDLFGRQAQNGGLGTHGGGAAGTMTRR